MVGLMHVQDRQAVAAVQPTLPTVARAIDDIVDRMRQGGRLIYVGAGTSGRLGLLDAAECPPTFNTDPNQVVGLMAGGISFPEAPDGRPVACGEHPKNTNTNNIIAIFFISPPFSFSVNYPSIVEFP